MAADGTIDIDVPIRRVSRDDVHYHVGTSFYGSSGALMLIEKGALGAQPWTLWIELLYQDESLPKC